MKKEQITKALGELKKSTKKRKFSQTIELIINLRDINLQKNPVDFYALLHHEKGKKAKICALIGPEMADKAKNFDKVILEKEFEVFKNDPKDVKKLAQEYDFFVAQANLMGNIATVFGRVLGPRGKMPNPKAGCVVPPNADMDAVYSKLQKTIKVSPKKAFSIQTTVGKEDMDEDKVIDNIITTYDAVKKALPGEENNIKSALIKMTMSKPVKIE